MKMTLILCFIFLCTGLYSQDSTNSFDYYGVHINLADNLKAKEFVINPYLRRVKSNRLTIGIIEKGNIDKLLPKFRRKYQPKERFDTKANEGFLSKKLKTYYFSYRDGLKKYYTAILLVEINDLAYLAYQVKSTSLNYINTGFEEANLAIKETTFEKNVIDGIVVPEAMTEFTLKSSVVPDENMIPGFVRSRFPPSLKQGKGDELLLVWNDIKDQCNLTILSKSGERLKEIGMEDGQIHDIIAFKDGFTMLISYPNIEKVLLGEDRLRHNHLYLEKRTWEGEVVFSTHLIGVDKIVKITDQKFESRGWQTTRLAWSGEYYGVYFPTKKSFGIGEIHQGGVYLVLDKDGNNLEDSEELDDYSNYWDVSHNFAQEIIFDGKKFVRFALGDAYPRAIAVRSSYPEHEHSWTSDIKSSFLEFPGEMGQNYVWDTHFGNATLQNERVFFSFDTEVDIRGNKFDGGRCNDVFIAEVDTNCNLINKFKLSASKKIEDQFLSHVFMNDSLVLCKWQMYNPYSIDKEGSPYKGGVSETLGLYNIRSKKMIKQESIPIRYKGKVSTELVKGKGGDTYYDFFSRSFHDSMCSPLLKDDDGRVWMVKFFLDQGGFELIEIIH
ncbi:MAG: hypothetical protein GQ574_11005 [Crocinitomix sp.]|nr:hypothetical protein [Crocinitomix sp.]